MNWLILIIILFLAVFLSAPISATAVVGNDAPRFRANIKWLWGFVRFRLGKTEMSVNILGWKIIKKRTGDQKNKTASSDPSGSEKHQGFKRFLNKPFACALLETLGRLKASVSINAWADLQLGFPDPARTGIAYGMLGSLCSMGMFPGLEVSPDFVSQKSSGILTVRFGAATGRLLWIAIRFALAAPVRALWWPELKWEGVK